MPQLLLGATVIVLAAYAVIYGLAIALYALMSAVPAVALLWATAGFSFLLINRFGPTSVSFSVNTTADYPRVFKSTARGLAGAAFPSIVLGVVAAAILLYVLGGNAERANGGADPAWIRQAGVGLAWLLTAGSTVAVYRWLCGKRIEQELTHLVELDEPVMQLVHGFRVGTNAANAVEVELPDPGWDFLLSTLASRGTAGSDVDGTEKARLAIVERTEFYQVVAQDYEEMRKELSYLKSMLHRATRIAATTGSPSLLALVDQVSVTHNSGALKTTLDARNRAAFGALVAHACQLLEPVLDFEKNVNNGRSSHSDDSARHQGRDASQTETVSTVHDVLRFLGLPLDSSRDSIKSRLNRMTMFYHPDKASELVEEERGNYEFKMKLINRSREILEAAGRL